MSWASFLETQKPQPLLCLTSSDIFSYRTHGNKRLNKFIEKFIHKYLISLSFALRKKCPYSELFWSTFFSHFHAFGLNTVRYSVSFRIQSKIATLSETNVVQDMKFTINDFFNKCKSRRPVVFCKKGVLRNFLKNSQENTCARVSFLIKLQALGNLRILRSF